MLSGVIQRRVLSRYQGEEMKILNISFSRLRIEPTTCGAYGHTLAPLRHSDLLQLLLGWYYIKLMYWFQFAVQWKII